MQRPQHQPPLDIQAANTNREEYRAVSSSAPVFSHFQTIRNQQHHLESYQSTTADLFHGDSLFPLSFDEDFDMAAHSDTTETEATTPPFVKLEDFHRPGHHIHDPSSATHTPAEPSSPSSLSLCNNYAKLSASVDGPVTMIKQ